MSNNKKSYDKTGQFKRSIGSLLLAATFSTMICGAAGSIPAYALSAEKSSNISQGFVAAPTIESLSVTFNDGIYSITANMYREVGDTSEIYSTHDPAKVYPEPPAEKHALDEVIAIWTAQKEKFNVAHDKFMLWKDSQLVAPNTEGLWGVAFSDNTVRTFESYTALENARQADYDSFNRERIELERLQSLKDKALYDYSQVATGEYEYSRSDFTYEIIASDTKYGSKAFETKDGTLEAGDVLPVHHNGIAGSATVRVNNSSGYLVLDIKLNAPLEDDPTSNVSYIDIVSTIPSPEVSPIKEIPPAPIEEEIPSETTPIENTPSVEEAVPGATPVGTVPLDNETPIMLPNEGEEQNISVEFPVEEIIPITDPAAIDISKMDKLASEPDTSRKEIENLSETGQNTEGLFIKIALLAFGGFLLIKGTNVFTGRKQA